MWAKTFDQRLLAWNSLRAECTALNTELALEKINVWWHQTPWTPFYLHWDSYETWPTPWEILDDNVYCPLTRALGMIYTIAVCNLDVAAELVETQDGDHLVMVDSGRQILNWDASATLNTEPGVITRRLPMSHFQEQL